MWRVAALAALALLAEAAAPVLMGIIGGPFACEGGQQITLRVGGALAPPRGRARADLACVHRPSAARGEWSRCVWDGP